MSASSLAATLGRYGNLWGRGHETFPKSLRRILSIKGKGEHATKFLQGLVTSDLNSEPNVPRMEPLTTDSSGSSESIGAKAETGAESATDISMPPPVEVEFTSKMRSTCFLDQKGRILTDAILWKNTIPSHDHDDQTDVSSNSTVEYLIDVPGDSADLLLDHLKKFKLRRTKVDIDDVSDNYSVHCNYGTLNAKGAPPGFMAAVDPRHPSLGVRILSFTDPTHEERKDRFSKMNSRFFPEANGTYSVLRKLTGVAEGSEIYGKTALECNQEFLNAIAFDKGCYLGQELTARSQHIGTIRKRIMPLIITDTYMEVPRPWVMASKLQDIGLDNLEADIVKGLGIGLDATEREYPPLLPRISAPGIGGIVAMIQGHLKLPTIPIPQMNPENNGNNDDGQQQQQQLVELSPEEEEYMKKLQIDNEILMKDLEKIALPGAQIVDQKDGNAIGQIVSLPAPGTPVVLAQMRLDQVGLLKNNSGTKWSQTNKILIGEGLREYRYLPFLPLWWPEIDSKTGKRKMS